MLSMSVHGLSTLKQFEGCRLDAYLDSGGIPTIGYGHIRGVKMGDTCTQEQADEMLKEDMARYEDCVNKSVLVAINQNQFDALVSFAFNLGCGALKGSTLLRRLNANKYDEAANQFLAWNKVRVNGVLERNHGLANRREAERKLFMEAVA